MRHPARPEAESRHNQSSQSEAPNACSTYISVVSAHNKWFTKFPDAPASIVQFCRKDLVPLHLLIGTRILIGISSEGSPFGALNVSFSRYLCGQKMPANGRNMPTHALYAIATRHPSPQRLHHTARHFSAGRALFQPMRPARLRL